MQNDQTMAKTKKNSKNEKTPSVLHIIVFFRSLGSGNRMSYHFKRNMAHTKPPSSAMFQLTPCKLAPSHPAWRHWKSRHQSSNGIQEFVGKNLRNIIDRIVLLPFLHVCISIYLCSCVIDACLLVNVSFDVLLEMFICPPAYLFYLAIYSFIYLSACLLICFWHLHLHLYLH